MVLFAAAPGQSTTLRGSYPFAVQFPASVEGGTDALPPSYTLYQPGVMTEISYSFRVDIVRKGLRRHEKYALPRTHSLAPVVREYVLTDSTSSFCVRVGCLCRYCTCPSRAQHSRRRPSSRGHTRTTLRSQSACPLSRSRRRGVPTLKKMHVVERICPKSRCVPLPTTMVFERRS